MHHFSYITDLKNLTKVFKCSDCQSFFSEFKKLKPHKRVCCSQPKLVFEEGNWNPKETVFEEFEKAGILIPESLRFYPYFFVYDFETWLKSCNSDQTSKNLVYKGSQELLSISFMGSEDEFPKFLPVENSVETVLEEWFRRMVQIRTKYVSMLYKAYQPFMIQLQEFENEKIRKRLTVLLLDWIDAMPVYGFNSSVFDLNVIQRYLPKLLSKF